MRLLNLTLASLVAGLLLAAPLAAQQMDQLETQSGRTYTGKILSNDGERVEIETTAGAIMKLPYGQLTPATQYRMKRAITGEDAKSELGLAEWCVEMTLYTEAKRHYKRALSADAEMGPEINASFTTARTTAANELLERAKQLKTSNKPNEARRILTTLVQELPLEDASAEAGQLLAADTAERKAHALDRAPAPAADSGDGGAVRNGGEAFSEEARKTFEPVLKSYHKILDATQAGLLKGGSQGIKEFEKALKEGDKARKATDKIRPQGAANEEVAEALLLVESKLEETLVEARVNMADAYLLRDSYKKASEIVNEGLAVFPQNVRLRQARDRAVSAASGNGFGWSIGGRARILR